MAVSDRDQYFFDLRGYLHLEGALTKDEVKDLNDVLDSRPSDLKHGDWWGNVHAHSFGDGDGLNLQRIYEAGEPFEKLIDHPAWFDLACHFVASEGGFDVVHGPVFIDENFVSFRGPGEGIGLHNGGVYGLSRCQFRVLNQQFHCNQVNVLIALTDIGPGDGGTVLVPGSHKSNFIHPDFNKFSMGMKDGCPSQLEGAIEPKLAAGDAIMFVDCCTHGSAIRVNEGQRRIAVYRYGPSWGNFRHGYLPSDELCARLTPQRRQIVHPQSLIAKRPGAATASA